MSLPHHLCSLRSLAAAISFIEFNTLTMLSAVAVAVAVAAVAAVAVAVAAVAVAVAVAAGRVLAALTLNRLGLSLRILAAFRQGWCLSRSPRTSRVLTSLISASVGMVLIFH
ncbi:MAG: hypothetical protein ACKO2P_21075 [Planctomycetota bacterium]